MNVGFGTHNLLQPMHATSRLPNEGGNDRDSIGYRSAVIDPKQWAASTVSKPLGAVTVEVFFAESGWATLKELLCLLGLGFTLCYIVMNKFPIPAVLLIYPARACFSSELMISAHEELVIMLIVAVADNRRDLRCFARDICGTYVLHASSRNGSMR